MYLAIATRPDIAFAIGKLSQFLAFYNFMHWLAAKQVLRYLKGTRTLHLKLSSTVLAHISSFSDVSHTCCPDTGQSIGGYCFSFGDTSMISWASRKRKTVAQLTCDSEYMAIGEAAHKCMWLWNLTSAIGLQQTNPTLLLTDNDAAMALSKDP
jgi:hypothetical protein